MSPQSSSVSTTLCLPMASCTARTSSATASLPSGATLTVSGSHLPKLCPSSSSSGSIKSATPVRPLSGSERSGRGAVSGRSSTVSVSRGSCGEAVSPDGGKDSPISPGASGTGSPTVQASPWESPGGAGEWLSGPGQTAGPTSGSACRQSSGIEARAARMRAADSADPERSAWASASRPDGSVSEGSAPADRSRSTTRLFLRPAASISGVDPAAVASVQVVAPPNVEANGCLHPGEDGHAHEGIHRFHRFIHAGCRPGLAGRIPELWWRSPLHTSDKWVPEPKGVFGAA
jgi:hypothetical protein